MQVNWLYSGLHESHATMRQWYARYVRRKSYLSCRVQATQVLCGSSIMEVLFYNNTNWIALAFTIDIIH